MGKDDLPEPRYPDVDIKLYISFQEDFRRLRKMLLKVEEMRKLIPKQDRFEADRLHNEILDLACETIDAHAERSKENREPTNNK